MTRYMLDTNTVSHLIRSHPSVLRRVLAAPMWSLSISAITEAELSFGLARRPAAHKLRAAIQEFLKRVDALPWTSEVAGRYGAVRAAMEGKGKVLAPFDLLIAAHSLAAGTVLVTSDRAFGKVPDLRTEDWTQ